MHNHVNGIGTLIRLKSMCRGLDRGSEVVFSHPYISYGSIKPYVVGTQKNHLIEGQIRIWGCEIILFLSSGMTVCYNHGTRCSSS